MRSLAIILATASFVAFSSAKAQEPTHLSAYVDANGFIDVQALTCAQLAGTYQEDADMLMAWYSGWYNGLAKKHYMDYAKGKEVEHQVILYCEAHTDILIIDALAAILKVDRAALGIKMD